ncbi:RHS repeat domain-containing protein [Parasulfitobacter algicola]|uniref:RHS repeat protein n=1 Tax=Parasulfitobacter algicola TaxID=2614809 RepID=A0ABX2IUI0_9RHOB|nr:RHS repeat protein [Sulfitobacter algicola]NSX55970.1 RHS repeat protein [Sulfitobacter algicola]
MKALIRKFSLLSVLLSCALLQPATVGAQTSEQEVFYTYKEVWILQAPLSPSRAYSDPVNNICKQISVDLGGFDGSGNVTVGTYNGDKDTITCTDEKGVTIVVSHVCEITKSNWSGIWGWDEVPCIKPTGVCEIEIEDSISLPSGRKTEDAIDWLSSRDSRFSVARSYSSKDTSNNVIRGTKMDAFLSHGATWRGNFDEIVQSGPYQYRTYDGQVIEFGGINSTTPALGGHKHTIRNVYHSSGYRLRVADGSGKLMYFAGAGNRTLREITWPDGYQIVIDRDAADSRILTVSDNKGQRAEYTWSATAVPNATAPLVTRIEIDSDYNGSTFSPQTAIAYLYEENTSSPEAPKLVETSIVDLNTSVSEIQSQYSYLEDDLYYPPALSSISDGRQAASGGTLTPYAEFTYGAGTGDALSTSRAGGVGSTSVGRNPDLTGPQEYNEDIYVENALGHQTIYRYTHVQGMLRVSEVEGVATANCLGTAKSFGYTPNAGAPLGFVYERVERNGSRTTFERDALGRVLTKTEDADGVSPRITAYTWFGDYHLPATRTTSQMTESFSYTAEGLLTQYSQTDVLVGSPTNGQTRTWDYTYTTLASGIKVLISTDGPGLLADGVNDVTTYTYDVNGALTGVTDPNGLTMQILSLNAQGQPTLVRQPDGIEWALDYDVDGRVLSVTLNPGTATAATATYTYDPVGLLTGMTTLLGQSTSFEYDDARRLIKATNAVGEEARFQYDAMDNITRTEYANGAAAASFWQETEFDELGRLLRSLGAEGQIWQFSHDREDNLASITDPLSYASTNSYDALNRVSQVVDRENYTTTLDHNDSDLMTDYTDPRGIETDFVYNGFGEVLQEVSADRGTITYTYNSRGLPTSMTDARGITSTYEYDNGGRLLARRFASDPSEDQTFAYDHDAGGTAPQGVGKLWETTDESGTTRRSYDAVTGNLASEERVIGGATYTIGYDTDVEGNLTALTYPSGKVLSLTRDAENRITSLALDLGTGGPPVDIVTGVAYRPMGPVAGFSYGDGGLYTATYDSSYRLTKQLDTRSGTTRREIDYGWSTRDNLISITDARAPSRNETYGYTPREMLSSADGRYGEQDYTYDGVGNRVSFAATVGGVTETDTYSYPLTDNRLAAISGATSRSFTYDAAGNVTYDNRTGQAYSYGYNDANRMAAFAINGVVQAEYTYNALGQQVIRHLTQENRVLHSVHDVDGNRIAEYEWDAVTQTSTLLREYVWMDGMAVAVVEGGAVYFVRTDHIGRPVFATNANGGKVWEVLYLPFGGVQEKAGTPINLRFPGQWYQSESGLQQNWMRDYDPTTGRYIQADPLGLVDGASVYGYALQSPGRYVDPRGERSTSPAPPPVVPVIPTRPPVTSGQRKPPVGFPSTHPMASWPQMAPWPEPAPSDTQCTTRDCLDIYAKIWNAVREMNRRFTNQAANKNDLTFIGHTEAILSYQRYMRKLIDEAKRRGCLHFDKRAHYYAWARPPAPGWIMPPHLRNSIREILK